MNHVGIRSLSLTLFITAALSISASSSAQLGGSPEQVAAQQALENTYTKLQITDQFLHLSVPGETMGQTTGVALNSKGHIFVYSRTNPEGIARGGIAAMLFEFDPERQIYQRVGSP